MNCRVLSRISLGTKHPAQYCGLRTATDGTRIKINQTSEAWPVWSDQTNQVSRHPSWPGGLLNHTKSVLHILNLRQILNTYFTFQWWKFTTIYFNCDRDIYSISPQSVNLCLRSNQSWQPHTGVPPLEMSSVQAVRFMSTVCPRPEECSQSEPSVLSLMSLKSRPIHLRVDSLSGHCLADTTVFDLPLAWVVWTNITQMHHTRCKWAQDVMDSRFYLSTCILRPMVMVIVALCSSHLL